MDRELPPVIVLMMMSTFIAYDSVNLNAQCAE